MSEGSFKPAWWLPNSHLQTMWPAVCRRRIAEIPLQRERFELPDGDFLDLEWTTHQDHGPIVIILHGFEGSIESHYAKGMLNSVARAGWRGVFMHFRGCSGEPNRLQRSYHSGDTGDIAMLVEDLKKRYPNVPIAVIGYSLGGNVLLKWLGQTGKNNPIKAAIAVSVPFELHKSLDCIQKGFAQLYHKHFLQCVCKRMADKFKKNPPDIIKLPEWGSLRTLRDFDDHVTAPLHGFASAQDYYVKSSSRQFLRNIEVPTLIVHAKDDPFTDAATIPNESELSKSVQLELTQYGGHVGFVTGKYPWRAEYWLERRIPEFLVNHLK